jgi:hypothetical protein
LSVLLEGAHAKTENGKPRNRFAVGVGVGVSDAAIWRSGRQARHMSLRLPVGCDAL